MKTRILLVLFVFWLAVPFNGFSQELPNVAIMKFDATHISITPYGLVFAYVDNDLYPKELYLPFAWFRKGLNVTEEGITIHTLHDYAQLRHEAVLKAKYDNSELYNMTLILPIRYSTNGYPDYSGGLSDAELEAKFNAQQAANYLILDTESE